MQACSTREQCSKCKIVQPACLPACQPPNKKFLFIYSVVVVVVQLDDGGR